MRVGALSGVVPAALEFAYDVAAAGTPLEGSTLVVTAVPVAVYCPGCDQVAAPADPLLLRCPGCGAPSGDVRAGRELDLTTLLVDQEPAERHAALVAPGDGR